MEDFDNQKPDLLSPNFVKVDDLSGDNWRGAATWARTIAIIGAVFCALILILCGFFGSYFLQLGSLFANSILVVLLSVVITIGVVLLLVISLFRFGNGVKQGVEIKDAVLFEKGMTSLKVFFIVAGVLSGLFIFMSLINIFTAL